LEEAFYKKIQEDPELENVASALGMNIHDLFEQYKLEQGMKVGGVDNIIVDEDIIKKLKEDLEARLTNN